MRLNISDERKIRAAVRSEGQHKIMLTCGWIAEINTSRDVDENVSAVVELTRSRSKRKVGTFTGTVGQCFAHACDALEEFELRRA